MFWKSREGELKAEIRKLKEELGGLKLKKKLEEEEIKHLIKMREEESDIRFERKVAEIERKAQDKIAVIKDDFRDKLEQFLTAKADDIKEMYAEIVKQMPDINVKLKGDL